MRRRNIVVYVRQDVIDRWKRRKSGEVRHRREPDFPFAYGSKQERLYDLAHKDDVIWVISAFRFARYRLPPSLIARLEVRELIDRENASAEDLQKIPPYFDPGWRYVALAVKKRSEYFPLNNAYEVLGETFTVGDRRTPLKNCRHCARLRNANNLYAGIPQHFQTIRLATPSAAARLEQFADEVRRRRMVFISYSRGAPQDDELAASLAELLSEKNIACWWDNWMMPRATRCWDPRVLSDALKDGLRQSAVVVALVNRSYFDTTRTAYQEWQIAGRLRDERENPKIIEIILAGRGSGQADKTIEGNSVERWAEKVETMLGIRRSR